jgi:3-methyladenine DNA glycosylase AlkD
MHPYLVPITKQFKQHAHAETAVSAKAYLLNQFEFFGLYTPQRRTLCKEHYRTYPVTDLKELETIVKECFTLDRREYQYFGIELFAFHKKLWRESSVKLMEHCIVTQSWWDSVDHIASEWLGPYFKMFPGKMEPITSRWNDSDNMWLQRSSIMFQKAYKKDTDTALLSKYILHCKGSKEFFIQKAIGWALREYSKANPEWVKNFVKKTKLPPLSEREALKRLNS